MQKASVLKISLKVMFCLNPMKKKVSKSMFDRWDYCCINVEVINLEVKKIYAYNMVEVVFYLFLQLILAMLNKFL